MDNERELDLGEIRTWLERYPPEPPREDVVAGIHRAVQRELVRVRWRVRLRRSLSGAGVAAAVALMILAWWPSSHELGMSADGEVTAQGFAHAFEFATRFEDPEIRPLASIAAEVRRMEARSAAVEAGVDRTAPVTENWLLEMDEVLGEPGADESML